MHGGPDVIPLQAQEKLKHLFIGFHADGRLSHMLFYPGLQLLLVIYKNPPVFHRWVIRLIIPLRQTDFLLLLHRHIRPEIPGGYANGFTKRIDAVYGPPPVRPRDHQSAAADALYISLLTQVPILILKPAAVNICPDFFRTSQRSRQDLRNECLFLRGRRPAQNLCQIRLQVGNRDFYRFRFFFTDTYPVSLSARYLKIHTRLLSFPVSVQTNLNVYLFLPLSPLSYLKNIELSVTLLAKSLYILTSFPLIW